MISSMYAFVVGIFEDEGDREAALSYVLSKLKDDGTVWDMDVQEIELVQWSDPHLNKQIKLYRDGKKFNKYTMNFQVRFAINGSYPEAQNWVVDKFMAEEAYNHMNLQMVRLSGGMLVEQSYRGPADENVGV